LVYIKTIANTLKRSSLQEQQQRQMRCRNIFKRLRFTSRDDYLSQFCRSVAVLILWSTDDTHSF